MGPTKFADVAKFALINPFARELHAVAVGCVTDDLLGSCPAR